MNTAAEKPRSAWSGAVTLALLAAVCTALVAATHELTRDRIEQNRQQFLQDSLRPVLDGLEYEGELSRSTLIIDVPQELPGNDPVTVYRIYTDGQPLAALFVVEPRNGYAGPIRLLVGVDAGGSVIRVRVLEHRETPGLGDRIEIGKSDWIEVFASMSLQTTGEERWRIRRDGGDIDQLSGASVTSRAVAQAVRDTLLYFAEHRESVFANADPGTGTSEQ